MERWQKEQAEKVHEMVEEARKHLNEAGFCREEDWLPNLAYMKWVERYICDRFKYMLRWEWVKAFSMLDDETLMLRKSDKAGLYLKYVRDYARRYLNEKGSV